MSNGDSSFKEYTTKVIMTIGEKLYLNEEMADFHFVFEFADGRCERIPAHKNFLATVSDVFRVMLNGDWIEKDKAKIVDASPSAFKEFLQFIYLGRVKLTAEYVAQVMNLGKKYDIAECVNACKDFLMNTLTSETVCWGFGLAILLEEQDLVEFCKNKIKHNANDVFSSAGFLHCDKKMLANILQIERFSCNATELIAAIMSWLKLASQEKHLTRELICAHLGDLFYKIPFGSLSLKEFVTFDNLHKGLLTHDEYKEIIQMIASEDFGPKIFTKNHKTLFGIVPIWNKDAVITCDRKQRLARSRYFIKNIETTILSTNTAIVLGAVICQALHENRNNAFFHTKELPSKITITENNSSKCSTTHGRFIVFNGNVNLKTFSDTRIPLPDPILIKPGFTYEIQMEQQPSANCCTLFPLVPKVEMASGIIVKFHRCTEGADEVNNGLIQALDFNLIET